MASQQILRLSYTPDLPNPTLISPIDLTIPPLSEATFTSARTETLTSAQNLPRKFKSYQSLPHEKPIEKSEVEKRQERHKEKKIIKSFQQAYPHEFIKDGKPSDNPEFSKALDLLGLTVTPANLARAYYSIPLQHRKLGGMTGLKVLDICSGSKIPDNDSSYKENNLFEPWFSRLCSLFGAVVFAIDSRPQDPNEKFYWKTVDVLEDLDSIKELIKTYGPFSIINASWLPYSNGGESGNWNQPEHPEYEKRKKWRLDLDILCKQSVVKGGIVIQQRQYGNQNFDISESTIIL